MGDLMPNWSAVMYRITERFDEELLVLLCDWTPPRDEQRWEDDGGAPMREAA
jgi:hypothetical protein